nr:hypothetical protein [Tanacetum cinerariifolium]
MASQTRYTVVPGDENRESLRESIATLIREEIEKLMVEMRVATVAATASGSGIVVRPRVEAQRGMQYHRVTKIKFPRFKIELAMRMFKARTLAKFYGLCKLEEAILGEAKQKQKMPLIPTLMFLNTNVITGPKPLALPAPNANWRNKASTS